MRPPEEIAAACERLAERVAADEYVVDEEIALFREAAEALRNTGVCPDCGGTIALARRYDALEVDYRALKADRDALLAWGRGMLAPPGPARDAQLAALPERLRPRLTDAILDVWTERAALSEHLRREMEQ
jgi:hypothetical protein